MLGDLETRARKYTGKSIHRGLRTAKNGPNCMLSDRDLGRNIRSLE